MIMTLWWLLGAALAVPIALLTYRAIRRRRLASSLRIASPAGIAESRFVAIGGVEQWIQIRGEDRANPILLIVSGHGLSMPPFTPQLRAWERYFTVVQWDRRNIGRTVSRNGTAAREQWTLDLFATDGIELVEYLCRRLGQDRIILLGHSQGSAVGVLMIGQRPDLFHAFVGTGQMADMPRNETESYELAVQRARASGHRKAAKALAEIGPPPYDQPRPWTVMLQAATLTDPEWPTWQRLTLRLLPFAPDYTLRDLYRGLRASILLPATLYHQLMAVTPARLGTRFEVPFFVFQGASDTLTLTSCVEPYLSDLQAPAKDLVNLPGGGHVALLTQANEFLAELVARVRPLARPTADNH
jgi:pimeloyl-ACP methyl ester carboxylesterase